jgi:hypothetical protein
VHPHRPRLVVVYALIHALPLQEAPVSGHRSGRFLAGTASCSARAGADLYVT